MTVLPSLTAFYEDHGILPTAFRCPSRPVCSAGSLDFVEAKMSYVGPRYGMDRMPRLAFLSLDPGRGRHDPCDRTAEAVRRRTLADDLASLPTNRHWYRTHEMAMPEGSTRSTKLAGRCTPKRRTVSARTREGQPPSRGGRRGGQARGRAPQFASEPEPVRLFRPVGRSRCIRSKRRRNWE